MGLTCRTTAISLGSIGVVSPFRLRTCNRAIIGCGESVRIFPILGTVFRGVLKRDPCGSPASVKIGVANGYVVSSDIMDGTSGRRVVEECCRILGSGLGNGYSRSTLCGVRLVVGRTRIAERSERIIHTTLLGTRKGSKTTYTVRLISNEIMANGAATLLKTSDTTLLGTLGAVANVSSRIRLVSPRVVRPLRALGARRFNDGGPEVRVSRALVTLSVYTTDSDVTGETLRKMDTLGNTRTRSAIILSRISRGMFGGLKVGLAYRTICNG